MTKVLVVNGSPKTIKSNTNFLLTPFIEGMKKAGASVDLLYASKLKIRPCIGCFKCWYETIGECFIQDDMQEIYLKLKSTDILVLATPVHSSIPGDMQNFLNRMVPLIEPILEFRDGRTRARCHEDVNISKILAVAVSGWWEIENLNLTISVIEEVAKNYSIEFAGAIRRPHCYPLQDETEKSKEILQKLEEVGSKFIKEGKIDQKDLDFISQPLATQEEYTKWKTNLYLKVKNALNEN
ncbi:MAG: flavodoxin family protein [Candidatus Heimdallarchaeaceae archaeon]